MKNHFPPALLLLSFLLPAKALEVTTTRPLSLPMIINGQKSGSISIPAGSSVETDGHVSEDKTVLVKRGELRGRVEASALNLPRTASSREVVAPTPAAVTNLAPPPLRSSTSPIPGTGESPVLSILTDHALTVLDDAKGRTATVSLKVVPRGFPAGAQLTYAWKQIQDTMSPDAADMATHPAEFSDPKADGTRVTFKDWGVYAIRVTVTDPARGLSASRNTWINVWDNHSHILVEGKPDPLAVAPGIAPPPHVRDLSPEPGPFHHPRLFCSDEDWKEIHERCVGGKGILASKSYAAMKARSGDLLNPKSKTGQYMAQLEKYADSGYKPEAMPNMATGAEQYRTKGSYDKSMQRKIDIADQAVDAMTGDLANACFLQWLKNDPATTHDQVASDDRALNQRLAKLVASFCRSSLENSWDRQTGAFHKDAPGYLEGIDQIGGPCGLRSPLAKAYDFIAPWMTEQQLRDCRDFFFATGAGRMTTSRGRCLVHDGIPDNHGVDRGYQQNGNFAAFGEGMVPKALVVAGEEKGADPRVIKTFLTPPAPKDPKILEDLKKVSAYDWIRPVGEDSGRKCPVGRPYTESESWPDARKVDSDNLLRSILWNQDGFTTPWGSLLEREAYHSTCAGQWSTAVMFARFGGNNQFVTCNFYNNINHYLNNEYPMGDLLKSEHFTSNNKSFNHHCGAGMMSVGQLRLLKYMYPDDPAVDYFYAARAPELEKKYGDMESCIFGLDPGIRDMKEALKPVAEAKKMPLTRLDPEEALVTMRSGWDDDALLVDFDDGWKGCGHMNAEKNSFAFFALGRSWALPPGYHKVHSGWHAGVQFQNPTWAACPETEGYVGQNPNCPPALPDSGYIRSFPTPPGKLLEVKEAPDQSWAFATGDASLAYNYMCTAEGGKRVGFPRSLFMYPGLLPDVLRRCPQGKEFFVDQPDGYSAYLVASPNTAVKMATRSILMSRGKRPYILIVDDFRKGDEPANYRWMFNNPSRGEDGKKDKEGEFLQAMEPGATSTEAILYHLNDKGSEPGKPRLLVRDVSESDNSKQPAIRMDQTRFKVPKEINDFYLAEDVNRIFIQRDNVVDPKYKVLLFPFRTGETLPKTTWNADHTELTVDKGNGDIDLLMFSTDPKDHRTKIQLKRVSG
jgi:hypothetical protein